MAESLLRTDLLIPVCLSDLASHVYITNVDKGVLEEDVWKQLDIDSYGAVIHKRLVRDTNCPHTLRAAVIYDKATDLSLVVKSLNGKVVGALTIIADIAQNIAQRYARQEQAEGKLPERGPNEVFVTGFSSQVEEKHLADAFSPFHGRAVIVKNCNGKSTNYAVVKFPLVSMAISAEIAYDGYCTAGGTLSVTVRRNDQTFEEGWDQLDKLMEKNDIDKKNDSVCSNVETKPISVGKACSLPVSAVFEMNRTKIAGEHNGNAKTFGFEKQQEPHQIEGGLGVKNEGQCDNSESLDINVKKAETEDQTDAKNSKMDAEKGNLELSESNGNKQTSESEGSLEAENGGMKGHPKTASSNQEAQEIKSEMDGGKDSISKLPVFRLKVEEAKETEGEMEAKNGESKGDSELSKTNNERIQEIEEDENSAQGATADERELQAVERILFIQRTSEEILEEIGRSMQELSVGDNPHSLPGACARVQPTIGSKLSPTSLNAPVSDHSSMASSTDSTESDTVLQFHME